jgi:hypothetical protein
MMRRCDILAASYRNCVKSFVEMIESDIIAVNVDRFEFTDRNLTANEIRAARVTISEFGSLKLDTRNLLRHLFTKCKRIINAGMAPLPLQQTVHWVNSSVER